MRAIVVSLLLFVRIGGAAEPDGPRTRSEVDSAIIYLKELIAANDDKNKERVNAQRETFNALLQSQKDAVTAAMAANDRAVLKLDVETKARFDTVNEFRKTLGDQAGEFIRRTEVLVMLKSVNDKLDIVSGHVDRMRSESEGVKGGWGYAVGVIGFVLTVAALLLMFVRPFTKAK